MQKRMPQKQIIIRGARVHNLKNINLEIPREKLVVITGLSGSGKSSLAFDTLYAEGQRRYVESLSSYARQFLQQMQKPDVDHIEGLSPAIAIEQKGISHNPRSTVGTVTEIYDYLRVLFASIGKPYCYKCGKEISPQSIQQIVDSITSYPQGSRLVIYAPLIRGKKGEFHKEFEQLRKDGYIRVRIDGQIKELTQDIRLDKNKVHHIDVVIDRLVLKEGIKKRLADSLQTALSLTDGVVKVAIGEKEELFSEKFACVDCGVSYQEISPRIFSFNSPYGACPRCGGLGTTVSFDVKKVVPNPKLSLKQGAIAPWAKRESIYFMQVLEALSRYYRFDLNTPFENLSQDIKDIILYGSGKRKIPFFYKNDRGEFFYEKEFEGVIPYLERRYKETESDLIREEIEKFMDKSPCPECNGSRLKKESLFVKINGKSIYDISKMTVKEALRYFSDLRLNKKDEQIAGVLLKEITARLSFLCEVGVEYITLDRASSTLSAGEAQRIRLATQIGSGLSGVLYILDEPTIGLHVRDTNRLLTTLRRLRELGNTVIVVEHDEDTIRCADYIIDMGPGAGTKGGEIVVRGSLEDLLREEKSLTGKYLSGKLKIPVPSKRKSPKRRFLTIKGAKGNNLKNVTVDIPIGLFTCVTGVSGSGKSTLIVDILYRFLAKKFYNAKEEPLEVEDIIGWEFIDKVINVDQSPIGKTPRSNPATYTGVFSLIRELFSQLPESRMRGYKPGRYSFNVKGGRCEACQGEGIIKIEMHFLPEVYVVCDLCQGKRYNRETLEIKYKGKNIADILDMTVEEALEFFSSYPSIKAKLKTLYDVGLGYIKLGQSAPTLSGGEAQRVKLAKELSKKATGNTLYILDEPTTGLHFADIEKLLEVLHKLRDKGNTIVVIEHNLEVIKTADYIIDLGPEGGEEGGRIVVCGTPEQVVMNPSSYTGKFLRKVLQI